MASCIPSESMKPFAIISAGILVEYWIVTITSSSTEEKDQSSKVETELAQSMDQEAGNPPSSQEKPESDGKTPSMTAISSPTTTQDTSSKGETELAQSMDQEAGNPPSSQDKPESDGETPSTTAMSFKSRCIAAFKLILRIWQVVSLLTVLVLDIMQFVDYVKANPDESGWSHYSCYVQIAINSANFKTLFINMFVVSGASNRAFPIFYYLLFIYKALIVPVGITHGFLSVCYVWITVGVFCVTLCALICTRWCFDACPALKAPLSCLLGINGDALVGWNAITSRSEKTAGMSIDEKSFAMRRFKREIISSPMAMVPIIVLIIMVPTLASNYLLSGDYSYMGALEHVFTERSIQVYFNNISTQFSSSFRFVATIL